MKQLFFGPFNTFFTEAQIEKLMNNSTYDSVSSMYVFNSIQCSDNSLSKVTLSSIGNNGLDDNSYFLSMRKITVNIICILALLKIELL